MVGFDVLEKSNDAVREVLDSSRCLLYQIASLVYLCF